MRGGASVLQLRHVGGDKGGALLEGRRLREMCDRRDALLIVDADADLALSIPAHGLRLDRGGLPTAEARRVLDPEQIVGRASATVEEALDSRVQGADYIELGPVFSKSTGEESAGSPAGLPMVARVKELAALPVVAVGSITAGSAAGVLGGRRRLRRRVRRVNLLRRPRGGGAPDGGGDDPIVSQRHTPETLWRTPSRGAPP